MLTFGKKLGSADLEYLTEGTLNVWKGSEPWVQVGPKEWELRDPDETTTEMVSVMASWRAIGPLTKSSYVNRERSADYLWADRSNQSSRRAVADVSVVGASETVYINGSLSDGKIGEQKSNGRMRASCPSSRHRRLSVAVKRGLRLGCGDLFLLQLPEWRHLHSPAISPTGTPPCGGSGPWASGGREGTVPSPSHSCMTRAHP